MLINGVYPNVHFLYNILRVNLCYITKAQSFTRRHKVHLRCFGIHYGLDLELPNTKSGDWRRRKQTSIIDEINPKQATCLTSLSGCGEANSKSTLMSSTIVGKLPHSFATCNTIIHLVRLVRY